MHVGGGSGFRYSVSGSIQYSDSSFDSRTYAVATLPSVSIGIANPGVFIAPIPAPVPTPVPLFGESLTVYSVTGEVYPTEKLGVRIGYTSFSDADFFDDRIEIGTNWYFRRWMAVEFAIARISFDTNRSGIEQDEALFRLVGRF